MAYHEWADGVRPPFATNARGGVGEALSGEDALLCGKKNLTQKGNMYHTYQSLLIRSSSDKPNPE